MLVKDIVERAVALYNDEGYARVTRTQYLQFLDDAINQLILSRPDAHVVTATVVLVPGTRQTLPEDGLTLIDITANKTVAGVIGGPIFQVERQNLDYFSSWQTVTPGSLIEEFAYDIRHPRTFWVSPPSDGTASVEMDYSAKVPEYAKMADDFAVVMEMEIPVSPVFKGPLVYYMLYLLYSTDSSSANDRNVAAQYERSFYTSIGAEYQATLTVIPHNAPTQSGVPVNG